MTLRPSTRRPAHACSRRRRGLTLIELVVVLVILTALGAILVPIVGSAITRSHLATCLTNFPEVTRMLNQASNLQGSYGNNWTNPVGVLVADGTQFTPTVLSADEIAALGDLGLETFTTPDPATADYNVTFNNGVESQTPSGLAGEQVVVLTAAAAEGLFLPTPAANQKYVWFAIDKSWSLLGTVTPEPPVHFGDAPGALPDEVYSRFGAVFLITEDDAGAADNADASASFKRVTLYIGNAAGTGGAFETADAHSAVYWQEIDTQE